MARPTTGSIYGQLLRELKAAGMRPDDAAIAANLAERALRQRRNALIVAARKLGLSYRHIADAFDLDVALIHRIAKPALTDGECKSTAIEPKLRSAA